MLRRVPCGADGVARVGRRQVYILPTRAGVLFGSVVLVMLLGSLNYQNNLGLLFGFFLAAVGLVAMHHCWANLLGLEVQARAGPPVFAGAPAPFEVTLRNTRGRPRYDLRIATGIGDVAPRHIPGGDQRTLVIQAPTRRRGMLPLPEVEIETRHPMGLFRAWCIAHTRASALVFPAPARHAPPPAVAAGDTRKPRGESGEGADDYLGPREYRAGDSMRHLDWKVLARERGLVVKQFGGDRGQEVWIDWGALSAGDPEVRIALLTRQTMDAAEADQRFGLRLPGVEEPLGHGEAHLRRCLTRLALYQHG